MKDFFLVASQVLFIILQCSSSRSATLLKVPSMYWTHLHSLPFSPQEILYTTSRALQLSWAPVLQRLQDGMWHPSSLNGFDITKLRLMVFAVHSTTLIFRPCTLITSLYRLASSPFGVASTNKTGSESPPLLTQFLPFSSFFFCLPPLF